MALTSLKRVLLPATVVVGVLAISSSVAAAAGQPIVTFGEASNQSLNTATLSGTVDKNGASTTYILEYGHSKLYGQSTPVRSVSASGAVPVSEVLTGLDPLSTYHVRLKATNSFGTTTSGDVAFEMKLGWHVNGKSLADLEGTPTYAVTATNSESVTIEGKVGLSPVKITCVKPGYLYSSGVLGSQYKVPFGNCTTYLNGKENPPCKPEEKDFVLELGPNLAPIGSQALHMGAECLIGKELKFGGFAVDAMAEQVLQPIEMTGYVPALPGLKVTYKSSYWGMTSEAYKGSPFGIS